VFMKRPIISSIVFLLLSPLAALRAADPPQTFDAPQRAAPAQIIAGANSDPLPTREYPNLLYNPSMETPDWLDSQQAELWNWRPKLTARDTSVSHSGRASLRIAGPTRDYSFQQDVILRPKTGYVLSGWVKANVAKGQGIWLEYPSGNARTKPVGQTDGWQRVEVRWTTPDVLPAGLVRIHWDLGEADVAWVDDLRLEPSDGQVPPAPAPKLSPAGGTFQGPVHVELGTDLAGAAIYYTIDGSDPTIFSTRYVEPFRLTGPTTVKARVHHAGHREGKVAEARFELEPRLGAGVPFSPAGWGQDVKTWWAHHPYNPAAAGRFTGPIESPAPRINVADVRDAHPQTNTAGIEEALTQLPVTGGTLWFPKDRGPYVVTQKSRTVLDYYQIGGPILILRRSHLHFLSDGAVLRYDGDQPTEMASGNMVALLNFSSMQYPDRHVLERPVGDFYFRGLNFDGGGKLVSALAFRHSSEVLVDDCEFRNFARSTDGHPGLISGNTVLDNLWARNCRFLQGKYGFFADGLHNGGLINCHFGADLQGGVLLFTNNDMAPLSASQRTCQYMVVEGCRFAGGPRDAILMTAANVLIRNNTSEGPLRTFVGHSGRGKSNIKHYLRYDGGGLNVLDNHVAQADVFVSLTNEVAQFARPESIMQNLIRGNRVDEMGTLLLIDPMANGGALNRESACVENVIVEGNTFGGHSPQIRVNPDALGRIREIHLGKNDFRNARKALVTDLRGKPLAAEGVIIEDR